MSSTEQLILNLNITAAQRLAVFKSIDRDHEASGVAPPYKYKHINEIPISMEQKILNLNITAAQRSSIFKSINLDYIASGKAPPYGYKHTNDFPTNVSIIPKRGVLSKTSMGDLIANNTQQPVNQFILLEPYNEKKKNKIYYRLKEHGNIRPDFFKLTGKHSVYATFRLYHEIASLTVHSYNPCLNDWVYNTCSDFDLGKNISKKITPLRFHRQIHPQLRYFATCLANCHNGDVDKFSVAHPTWVFGKSKKSQELLCPCKSEKCAAVWTAARYQSKRKAPPVPSDKLVAESKKQKN